MNDEIGAKARRKAPSSRHHQQYLALHVAGRTGNPGLSDAVMTIEQDIPMFRRNTAAFTHQLPAYSLSNVDLYIQASESSFSPTPARSTATSNSPSSSN
jgi:hypothetical protein